MRTIICGSRSALTYAYVLNAVAEAVLFDGIVPTVILSGAARGADSLGEQYAAAHGIPLELYPADWLKSGKAAGFLRNHLMSTKADACIAIRMPGISNGTDHMIACAQSRGLKVSVYRVAQNDVPKMVAPIIRRGL